MFGKTSKLTALAARKKLLLAESDLNRALLVKELARIKSDIHALTSQARSHGLLVAAAIRAGSAVKGLFQTFFGRAKPKETRRPSWFSSLYRGLRTGALIWAALRAKKS